MNKIKVILKTILILILVLLMNGLLILNTVQAVNINSANLYPAGECPTLLKYKGINVKVTYVKYDNGESSYPAYCLDKNLPGIEINSYPVSVENAITDVGLWRRVINGFPYKSVSELGCMTEEEAFTATKQAIYCYIHENNPSDYEAVGEAGQRTLNALNMIVSNAQNSNETKISNIIEINRKSNKWEQDKLEENYVSKVYSVSSEADITNYSISLKNTNKNVIEGMKIVDEKNIEREEFKPSEKFKIMIPIKNMKEKEIFKIEVNAKVRTKPVLYGKAPNASYQDYALAVAIYEDGIGNINDEYDKNETRIIIKKQDEVSKQLLEGVEFEILNEEKEIIYNNLKTNEKGEIEILNIIPGKYFIKETKTLDGYILNDELFEIDIKLNQIMKITIDNKKGEKPKTEIENIEKKVEAKKLPLTGM